MRLLIIGAGAVGIGIGTALLADGHEVAFQASDRTASALERNGCRRTGMFGEVAFPPSAFQVLRTGDLEDRPPPDAVLVCAKAYDSRPIAERLAGWIQLRDAACPIVLFQNGMGNAENFVPHFGEERVCNARVITGFERHERWSVDVTVHADRIHIGSLYRNPPVIIDRLARAIDAGGLPAASTDRISEDLWAKLLYNAALNPLGAILDVPYGALGENPLTRRLLESTVGEIFGVMKAGGHRTHWNEAATYLEIFFAELLPPTSAHRSSMLQDVREGRRTEIDAISGHVVERARELGVRAPVNESLLRLVRGIEAKSMAEDVHSAVDPKSVQT